VSQRWLHPFRWFGCKEGRISMISGRKRGLVFWKNWRQVWGNARSRRPLMTLLIKLDYQSLKDPMWRISKWLNKSLRKLTKIFNFTSTRISTNGLTSFTKKFGLKRTPIRMPHSSLIGISPFKASKTSLMNAITSTMSKKNVSSKDLSITRISALFHYQTRANFTKPYIKLSQTLLIIWVVIMQIHPKRSLICGRFHSKNLLILTLRRNLKPERRKLIRLRLSGLNELKRRNGLKKRKSWWLKILRIEYDQKPLTKSWQNLMDSKAKQST